MSTTTTTPTVGVISLPQARGMIDKISDHTVEFVEALETVDPSTLEDVLTRDLQAAFPDFDLDSFFREGIDGDPHFLEVRLAFECGWVATEFQVDSVTDAVTVSDSIEEQETSAPLLDADELETMAERERHAVDHGGLRSEIWEERSEIVEAIRDNDHLRTVRAVEAFDKRAEELAMERAEKELEVLSSLPFDFFHEDFCEDFFGDGWAPETATLAQWEMLARETGNGWDATAGIEISVTNPLSVTVTAWAVKPCVEPDNAGDVVEVVQTFTIKETTP